MTRSVASRKADKVLMKKAMIAADEWARINLYQRQIGDQNGEARICSGRCLQRTYEIGIKQ